MKILNEEEKDLFSDPDVIKAVSKVLNAFAGSMASDLGKLDILAVSERDLLIRHAMAQGASMLARNASTYLSKLQK